MSQHFLPSGLKEMYTFHLGELMADFVKIVFCCIERCRVGNISQYPCIITPYQ